jgi:hypothetical protein
MNFSLKKLLTNYLEKIINVNVKMNSFLVNYFIKDN